MIDLVDIAEVARRLEVKRDTVHMWRFRGLLPEPDFKLDVGPVWDWETIKDWARVTGRFKGD